MKNTKKKELLILYKLLYTAIILLVYSIGKGLPLYMIDVSAYMHKSIGAEDLLFQTINGDIFQCSVFALGISPYMMATMLVQILSAFRKQEYRSKISPKKTNRQMLGIALVIAIVQAVLRVQDLIFRVQGPELLFAQFLAVMEMVTGAMIIMWLCNRNKKYGIGGQTALIFVNIIDGIATTLKGNEISKWPMPLAISLVVMLVVIFMENTEMRIPVQRISIHNIYYDKNYMAIKLNPIGVMPAMFSTVAFMIPTMLFQGLDMLMPGNAQVQWLMEHVTLRQPLGIGIYICLVYILSIGFSRVFISPKDMTDQFLKSGDSLLNIHAGKDTQRYLSRVVTSISLFSATVLSICLSVPMILQMTGHMDSALGALPSSVLMLTGVWSNLYREVRAIRDLEAYQPFI